MCLYSLGTCIDICILHSQCDGRCHCRCSGCKTQCCWLCGKKLPATNPYSHFTSKGCAAVGGGAEAQGQGMPAGAWAVLPGEVPRADAAKAALAAMRQARERVGRRGARLQAMVPGAAQPAQHGAPRLLPGDPRAAFDRLLAQQAELARQMQEQMNRRPGRGRALKPGAAQLA